MNKKHIEDIADGRRKRRLALLRQIPIDHIDALIEALAMTLSEGRASVPEVIAQGDQRTRDKISEYLAALRGAKK